MSAPDTANQATPLEPAKLAELVADFASDVKAQEIVELDLRGVLGYTDYFVVATGGTDRQVKAIHDRIHEGMKKEHGLLPRRVEGASRGPLDPDGLLRRDRPHLHPRGARVLPPRAALGRGARSAYVEERPPTTSAGTRRARAGRR